MKFILYSNDLTKLQGFIISHDFGATIVGCVELELRQSQFIILNCKERFFPQKNVNKH